MIVTAKLLFHKCLQNMQDVGTNDEFMVSRVFFSIELPGKRFENLFVDLKQTAGDDYERGSIEVSSPQGAIGNLDYAAFRDAVETYYRKLIGSSGQGIKIQGGSAIMRDNWFHIPMTTEIAIDTESGGW